MPPEPIASPRWHRYVPWALGLVAFAIAAKKISSGYRDFDIYLTVAHEFQAGGLDLCRPRENSGPWVYPPCAALPFVALKATLGDDGARWAWCVGLGLATALLLRALAQAVAAVGGLRPWQWVAFGLLFQRWIAQNLTHGQLSLWVGTLVAMGVASLVHKKNLRAGVWLGLAAACKVTPLLFLPALPLMGRWRAAGAMLGTILVAVLLSPWPFSGTDEHVRHLTDFWRTTTQAVVAPDQSAIAVDYMGPSIAGTLDYVLQPRQAAPGGYTANFANVSDATLRAIRLTWSALLGSLLLWWFLAARKHDTKRRLLEQCAVVTLAISFFAPLVRIYHLAATLLPAALFCRGPRNKQDWLWLSTAFVLLITLTLRQKNLMGVDIWRYLDLGGFLHCALIGMMIWLLRQVRQEPPTAQ